MSVQERSARAEAIGKAMEPFMRFVSTSTWRAKAESPGTCDFVFGMPHDMPLPDVVAALQKMVVPRSPSWYGYKWSESDAVRTVVRTLRERTGLRFESDDVCMTTGGYAAIAVALCALVDPSDEVIFVSPPWFFYEALIVTYGGIAVRVGVDPDTFDLDLAAIEAAITPRTRAIIINSPNNPTGKVYPASTLTALANLLTRANASLSRPIVLLSDEAYSRITFGDEPFPSPVRFYDHSLLLYTYGKTLLIPGQRIGYIAVGPKMMHRDAMRSALFMAQVMTGYAFPNAVMQYALPDLEKASIDVNHIRQKRDRLCAALAEIGYEVHPPDGTFYLLPRCPIDDDVLFCDMLAEHQVFCLPGSVVEMPGYMRVSLTATDEMIERAIPGFSAAFQQAMATVR